MNILKGTSFSTNEPEELCEKRNLKLADPINAIVIRSFLLVLFLMPSISLSATVYSIRYYGQLGLFPTAQSACTAHETFTPHISNQFPVFFPSGHVQCHGTYQSGVVGIAEVLIPQPGQCPSDYIDDGNGNCLEVTLEPDHKQATDIASCSNPVAGDPIIVATGNSFQTEADYRSSMPFGLGFTRYYNSTSNPIDKGVGKKWHYSHIRNIFETNETNVQVSRGNGQTFLFNFDGSNWVGDVDIPDTLEELLDGGGVRIGWIYTDSNDTVETYNAEGQLLTVTNRAGQSQILVHDVTIADGGDDNSATLDKVVSYTGEEMSFTYDNSQRINVMTDPEGNVYHYAYDAIGNLISATYPDETPSDLSNNPVRTYHYENTTFPHHLTGLTDETGSRVTWAFDSEGRAISSELDGGVDKVTLDYSVADQVTVTNPLGKDTTYHFTTLHGVKKVTQIEGHATPSCAGASQNYTYDANGYIASKTDWQGNITTYEHDARGLETSRTEASGTTQARTIITQWHPDFRLPTQITEPGKVTTYNYDGMGRQLSRTVNEQ